MAVLRRTFGFLAIAGLIAALNILITIENPFSVWTIAAVALAVGAGGLWLALFLVGLMSTARRGEGAGALNSVVASLALLGIFVVVYAFLAQMHVSIDLTREGRRDLSSQSIKVLESLNKAVGVYCFFTKTDDANVIVTKEKTRRFLEHCQRYTGQLQVEFLDPQEERAALDSLDVQRVPPQGAIALQCGTRKRLIPLSEKTARLEERDFTNALINVVRNSEPQVYFLTGHGERDGADTQSPDGSGLLEALIGREGNRTHALTIPVTEPRIPGDAALVVINNPKSDLHPREIQALSDYIDRGGRLLVLLDAWWKVIGDTQPTEQLRPWLRQTFGVKIGDDLIVSKETATDVMLVPDWSILNVRGDTEFRGSYDDTHPITRGFDKRMQLTAARSVTLDASAPQGTAGTVILRTPPSYWGEKNLQLLQERKQAEPESGEEKGPVGVAAAVTKKTSAPVGDTQQTRDARVVVVGNSVFAANEGVKVLGHLNFILNTVAWLTESEDLIAIRPVGQEDSPLLLSKGEQRAVAWIAVLGVLQAVVVAGVIVHRVRRRYR